MRNGNNSMKLLNVKQVAELIGAKPSTIYEWAGQGTIPSFKLNGLLRFSEDDILAWIKKCQKKSIEVYNADIDRRLRKGGLD